MGANGIFSLCFEMKVRIQLRMAAESKLLRDGRGEHSIHFESCVFGIRRKHVCVGPMIISNSNDEKTER